MSAVKTHLSLNVSNVDKSAAWYEAFFGRPVHKRREGYANFDLDAPALKLALQEHKPEGKGALNHLGILVPSTEEVTAAKERLESAGLVTFSEENVTCCYARQDKIWARDPDGNAWEVYTLLDDMLDEHEQVAESVSGCCADGANERCCSAETSAACCSA